MSKILHYLIEVAEAVGAVDCAHYYSKDFITIDGTTEDGKKFSITLHIKEEENDGN